LKLFKLGSAVIRIGTGIVVIFFAFIGFNKYFFENQEQLEKYQKLSSHGVPIQATSDGTYKETKFKIKGAEVELYSINYTFSVDGLTYKGKAYIDHPDSVRTEIAVKYLAEEPEVNAANVKRELIKAREDMESSADLWLALGAFIVSILIIIFGIRKFRKALRTP